MPGSQIRRFSCIRFLQSFHLLSSVSRTQPVLRHFAAKTAANPLKGGIFVKRSGIVCPNCHGEIRPEIILDHEGDTTVCCEFCGCPLMVVHNDVPVTDRSVSGPSQAALERLKAEGEEKRKNRTWMLGTAMILWGAFLSLFLLKRDFVMASAGIGMIFSGMALCVVTLHALH